MKRSDWTVTQTSTRPAGSPEHCFYCGEPIGTQHKLDCVIRSKTVVVDFTVRVVLDVPEIWDEGGINHHYNDSSWCADSLLQYIQNRHRQFELRANGKNSCLCNLATAKFVRDANEQDEKDYGVTFVDECDS